MSNMRSAAMLNLLNLSSKKNVSFIIFSFEFFAMGPDYALNPSWISVFCNRLKNSPKNGKYSSKVHWSKNYAAEGDFNTMRDKKQGKVRKTG
jgi:hypothetical protein